MSDLFLYFFVGKAGTIQMDYGIGFEKFDERSGRAVRIRDFFHRAVPGDLVNAPFVDQQLAVDPIECSYSEIALLFQLSNREVSVKNAGHERVDDRVLVHKILPGNAFAPGRLRESISGSADEDRGDGEGAKKAFVECGMTNHTGKGFGNGYK